MRVLLPMVAAVAMAFAGVAKAEDLKSGLQAGEGLDAFDVEKCGGAADDGVAVGKKLCYRCKLGGRPMVMVFTRSADDKLGKLVSELDKTVTAKEDAKLAAFVNLIGEDAEALKKTATKFEKSHKAGKVAIVVPEDQPNGPASYKLSKDADVTVIIAKDSKVVANHAFKADKLDADAIKKIVADAEKAVE
jgi:hypothetical protein